jgi:hypothetical protein
MDSPKKETFELESPGATSDNRGRKPGTLVPGSVPWHLDQLTVGGVFLQPDSPNAAQKIAVQVSRYQDLNGGQFSVKLCIGSPVALDLMPFRFFRIERIA